MEESDLIMFGHIRHEGNQVVSNEEIDKQEVEKSEFLSSFFFQSLHGF